MTIRLSPASRSVWNLVVSCLLHAWVAALAIQLVWRAWESPVVHDCEHSILPPGGRGDATSRQAAQLMRQALTRPESAVGVASLSKHHAAPAGSALADVQRHYLSDMPGKIAVEPVMISTGLSLMSGSGRLGAGTGFCCPGRSERHTPVRALASVGLELEAPSPLHADEIPRKLQALRRQLEQLHPQARFTLTCRGSAFRTFSPDALAPTPANQAAALRFAEAFLEEELRRAAQVERTP